MPFTPAPGKPAERCRPAVTPECSPPHLSNRWPRHAAAERTRPHDLWPAHPSTSAARPHDVEDGTLPTVGMSVTAMSSSLHVSCLRAARRRASSVFRADGGVFWRKSLVGNVRHWHKADIPAFYIRSALIQPILQGLGQAHAHISAYCPGRSQRAPNLRGCVYRGAVL